MKKADNELSAVGRAQKAWLASPEGRKARLRASRMFAQLGNFEAYSVGICSASICT
jgi:hypothetical protein